jgi:predicted RNA-binding protein YlxR (DUF448 family)
MYFGRGCYIDPSAAEVRRRQPKNIRTAAAEKMWRATEPVEFS